MPRPTASQFNYLNYEDFAREVSIRMSEHRLDKNITQREMASRLNRSKAYISNIENAKTQCPAYILNAYCRILRVSPETILNYTVEESEERAIMSSLEHLSPSELHTVYTMVTALAQAHTQE